MYRATFTYPNRNRLIQAVHQGACIRVTRTKSTRAVSRIRPLMADGCRVSNSPWNQATWVGLLCSGYVGVADWSYDATAFVCKVSFVQLTLLVAVSEFVERLNNQLSPLKTGVSENLSIENNCIPMLIHE